MVHFRIGLTASSFSAPWRSGTGSRQDCGQVSSVFVFDIYLYIYICVCVCMIICCISV